MPPITSEMLTEYFLVFLFTNKPRAYSKLTFNKCKKVYTIELINPIRIIKLLMLMSSFKKYKVMNLT